MGMAERRRIQTLVEHPDDTWLVRFCEYTSGKMKLKANGELRRQEDVLKMTGRDRQALVGDGI